MKINGIAFLLFLAIAFSACNKSTVSKIPQISLIAFVPKDSMIVNIDTCYIEFSLVDGDGDIGNDTVSVIHLKDSRFDSAGFVKTPFPAIDASIEDPKKGLQGTCLFFPVPQPTPRTDPFHVIHGDTLSYELYITDRAGHESNHIITHPFIVRP
ncbi:MAG: hypothetical protein ACHQD8_00865 [Chitinophagales bacterium]